MFQLFALGGLPGRPTGGISSRTTVVLISVILIYTNSLGILPSTSSILIDPLSISLIPSVWATQCTRPERSFFLATVRCDEPSEARRSKNKLRTFDASELAQNIL